MFFNTPEEKEMDFEPVPNGIYRVTVNSLESKATKAGTGRYIAATLQVCEGEFEGRKVFHNFNIENPNETAKKIGRSEFKKFLKALGHEQPLQTEDEIKQFVDAVLYAELKTEKGSDGVERNRVKSFHDQVPWEGSAGASSRGYGGTPGLDDIPF